MRAVWERRNGPGAQPGPGPPPTAADGTPLNAIFACYRPLSAFAPISAGFGDRSGRFSGTVRAH